MKVLVIPDVHLKPWIFHRASELMKDKTADLAVCLMDIADDWRQQFNLDLYIQTYDAAVRFAVDYFLYDNIDNVIEQKLQILSTTSSRTNDILPESPNNSSDVEGKE